MKPVKSSTFVHHCDTSLLRACHLAGPAAEYRVTGRSGGRHWCSDLAAAAGDARIIGIHVDDLWPDAVALVEHPSDIEIIAETLLRRGRLTGEKIEALIGGEWCSPSFG
jgi:hypothetical protein